MSADTRIIMRTLVDLREELRHEIERIDLELCHIRYFQVAHASQSGQHQDTRARKVRRAQWARGVGQKPS